MSTSATPSPIPLPGAPGLTQVQRVVYTFSAPSRTMTDIGRSASWWLPLVLTSVVALLFSLTVNSKIGFKQIAQSQMERNARVQEAMERMPAEQRERTLKFQTIVIQAAFYSTPVSALLSYVIYAALLLAIFNFGFGAELRFGRAMAISAYGLLVSTAKAVLSMIVLLAGGLDPSSFDLENPIATNPSHFWSNESSPFLYGVTQAFDIFIIWMIALMALGVSRNTKVKTRTAFVALFALYFLYRVARGAIAVATS